MELDLTRDALADLCGWSPPKSLGRSVLGILGSRLTALHESSSEPIIIAPAEEFWSHRARNLIRRDLTTMKRRKQRENKSMEEKIMGYSPKITF